MSFPAILVTLVAVTGFIWLLDKWLWASQRAPGQKEPVIVEYAKSFFPIILAVLVIRSFIVEPFRIPSASMVPSLHIGDFILVNKYSYGIRLPVLNTKVVDMDTPKRGDVMVFRHPPQPTVDYIKRVVAVPGDRVQYQNKVLSINGKVMKQTPQQKSLDMLGVVPANSQLFLEDLTGVSHQIIRNTNPPHFRVDFIVPEGQYFVLGDNRDNSSDSRVWGTVPESHIVGRAFYIWMSWDCNAHWSCINVERIGQTIE